MKDLKETYKEIRQMMEHLAQGDEDVSAWVTKSKAVQAVTRIPGDASTRRYFRVLSREGTSYIVQSMESFEKEGHNLPFLIVQKHLAQANVDVPAVLDIDPAKGFVLLEDLGDVTLLRRLQEVANSDVERHLYERVIDSLICLQINASPDSPIGKKANLDAFKLRFDHEKLMWEMDFCIEHFYQKYLKREITDKDLRLMRDGLSEICTYLAEQPMVLTHRDFHSRNVMVAPPEAKGKDDRLVMIDFQDARMGPPQYDLASLLKDSYYQLEESQIQKLIDYYVVRWEALTGQRLDRGHFHYVFDLMSVQRNFKAIGSFASFLNRRGNATYLKYIGNTFENIRRTLLKYPQYSGLREVLFHYYYF